MNTLLLLMVCAVLAGALLRYRRERRLQGRHLDGAQRARDDALALLHALPVAVIGTDHQGVVCYLNRDAEALTGHDRAQGDGMPIAALLALHQDGVALDARQRILDCLRPGAASEPACAAVLLRRADGKRVDVEHSCAPVALAPQPGAVMLIHDVSARHHVEARLGLIGQHDGLTGLPNRLQFQSRLERAIVVARRERGLLAVLLVEIDHFAALATSLGAEAADQLQVECARRLLHCLHKADTVAREGSGRFIVLLTELPGSQEAVAAAERIASALAAPFAAAGHAAPTPAGIGLALYPDDDDEADALIAKADLALRAARADGGWTRYAAGMQARSCARLLMETALQHALERQQFVLGYQPRLDLKTHRVIGVKALLRWRHPELGLVLPLEFLPVLERSALSLPVGAWALASAAGQIAHWAALGQELSVSVSLTARQFHHPDTPSALAAMLSEAKAPARLLVLEISERALLDRHQDCEAILNGFRQLGVRVCIGDVGSGEASLARLKRFPADMVRIEKRLVDALRQPAADGAAGPDAMARAIIVMAHALNLRTLACGVETVAQLAQLTTLECDEAFGFGVGRVVAASRIDELIRNGRQHQPEPHI